MLGGGGREFSLRNPLRGGSSGNSASVGSGGGGDDNSSPAARLRGTIQANNARSPPSPAASPSYAAFPLRPTQSFSGVTSSSSSPTRNPLLKQQQQQQQQQRRSVSYRNVPKKMGFSPKYGSSNSSNGGGGGGGGSRWNFPGISPANSMDSADQQQSLYSTTTGVSSRVGKAASHVGVGSSTSSYHQQQQQQLGMSLQTSSFDDCYSPRTPGYHDAFALLDGVERGSSNGTATTPTARTTISTTQHTTPSPKSSNSSGGIRSFFPSSPSRRQQNYNNVHSVESSPSTSPNRRPPQSQSMVANNQNQHQNPSTPTRIVVGNVSGGGGNTNDNMIERRQPNRLFIKDESTIGGATTSTAAVGAASPPPLNPRTPPRQQQQQQQTNAKYNSSPSSDSMPPPPSASKMKSDQPPQSTQQPTPPKQQQQQQPQPQQQEQQQQQQPQQPTSPSTTTSSSNTNTRAASPRRHPSPLNGASRMVNWAKAKTTGERARSSSGTRGGGGGAGYSRAVSRVLQEVGGGGDDDILIDGGGGGSTSSRPPLSNAGSGKSDREQQQQQMQQARQEETEMKQPSRIGSVGRLKNRSPSPIRHYLGRLSITKSSTDDRPQSQPPQPQQQQQRSPRGQQQQQKPPLSPEKHSQSSVESDDNDDYIRDSSIDLMVNCMVHRTTMSFDVDSPEAAETNNNGTLLESKPISPSSRKKHQQTMLKSSIKESYLEDNDEEGYFINTTSFNIFESHEFLTAMGGSVSDASLATNYIRTGDSLCAGEKADKFDQAVQVYYAGLGAILARIREWTVECSKGELVSSSSSSTEQPGASQVTYHDLLQVAHSPEMNLLLLAMSSILLRAGNAHFRLRQYEFACRDYVSAQCYRLVRHEAKDIISDERTRHSESHIEDAKLNGRISNNMASAQSKRGMYNEARSEYTKALQIKQGTLETLHNAGGGKNDMDKDLISDIASTFHNIGLLRMKCGESKKAEKAYKQSLSLRVKKFGVNDIGISSTLNALGGLYYHQHQHDDAFRSYKESLRIWKSHSGKSDLKTAEYYYNIGLVFYSKGPFIKAMSAVAECLRIRREHLAGNERLPIASALYLLGLIATSLGNYDEALTLLQESLAIRQEFLEQQRDHLLLLNVQVALGIVHQKRNDFDNAMDCLSVALEGRSHRLGRDHESVAEVLQAIGVAYTDASEYQKASTTFEEALRIRKSSMSSGVDVAETLNALGLVHFKTGDADKAIEMCEEALGELKEAVEFDHIMVAKVLKNAGDYYQYVEAYDDALEAYSESYRIMTEFYGKEHVFMSEILNELGVTRFKKGDYMTSKQLFTEALRLMRLSQNESNKPAIFSTLNHLGHALYKNNELDLAAETYIESFNIQVSIVTGVSNVGLKEFGTQLNAIKDRVSTMEQEKKDITELSGSLGGIASILRYLGLVIQEQGDLEAALSTNKLSLSVRLCQPFKDHSAIALMAETIAMFEYKRNNLGSAMDYFNQALDAKKIYQGESTIDVARTVNNLANIHFSLGNLDEAMELYQEALEIKKHCLGDESDEVANTLNNIAHVMVNAGKEQEALKVYHNVLKIRQDLYGKSHASVAGTLASMGDVYIKLGKLDIAKTYFEQCIRIQKVRQDLCDERVMENLGSIYGKLGEWHKAESTFKEIIELKRATHGDECLDVAKSLDLLAISYIEQDRYADSIPHLEEALRVRKACLDDDDDEILASLNKLAFVYKSLNMTEQMMEIRAEFDAIQVRKRRTCQF